MTPSCSPRFTLAPVFAMIDARCAVKTVVAGAVPAMLDDDILSVVRVTRHDVRVDDRAVGDRAHFIQRFAAGIALHRANVDAFMEARVNQTAGGFDRVAHKTVLATFPRRRFHSFVISSDILVKFRAAAVEKCVVIRRQREIQVAGCRMGLNQRTCNQR